MSGIFFYLYVQYIIQTKDFSSLLFTVTSTALLEDSISSYTRNLLQFLLRRKEENPIEYHTPFPIVSDIHTETSSLRNLKIMPRNLNPLPSGTMATFFLTAVGPIQHTKEGDIGREKTILMTSLRLARAAAVSRRQLLITPLPPAYRGQCVHSFM